MKKKMTKSDNKWIGGVLAGIAEYFNINPNVVRIIYIVLTLILIPHLIVVPLFIFIYVILFILMPNNNDYNGKKKSHRKRKKIHAEERDIK